MKKYRLKQWYPGLPVNWKEEEIVVHKTDMKDYVQHKQVEQKYICPYFFVPELEVENNPDFWELVKKTTWSLEEINEAIEKWKFTSKNEELLLVSELKSEFGLCKILKLPY